MRIESEESICFALTKQASKEHFGSVDGGRCRRRVAGHVLPAGQAAAVLRRCEVAASMASDQIAEPPGRAVKTRPSEATRGERDRVIPARVVVGDGGSVATVL